MILRIYNQVWQFSIWDMIYILFKINILHVQNSFKENQILDKIKSLIKNQQFWCQFLIYKDCPSISNACTLGPSFKIKLVICVISIDIKGNVFSLYFKIQQVCTHFSPNEEKQHIQSWKLNYEPFYNQNPQCGLISHLF